MRVQLNGSDLIKKKRKEEELDELKVRKRVGRPEKTGVGIFRGAVSVT